MKIWFEFLGGNLFNDMEGIDVGASVEKYAELAEEAIRAKYPDAVIEVSYQLGVEGAGGGVHVAGEAVAENTFRQMQNEESIQLDVEAITERVFNAGEWYVMTNTEEAD